jgi:prefoldin subunit 5
MLNNPDTKEQQDVAATFEYVRENAKGLDRASEQLEEFLNSLDDALDEIDGA